MQGRERRRRRSAYVPCAAALALSLAVVWLPSGGAGAPPARIGVVVDGAQRFQRIDGFGVNANPAGWSSTERRVVLDTLTEGLGARIWRVIVENADWEATNDNDDPRSFDW